MTEAADAASDEHMQATTRNTRKRTRTLENEAEDPNAGPDGKFLKFITYLFLNVLTDVY
jgi:hypothetical protein